MGVVVRPATGVDVPLLAAIELAAGARFREVGMGSIADDEPLPEAELRAAAADGRLWVAELDGAVVGYVLAVLLDDGAPHLEQVSVRPEAGGRGVGEALVRTVEAWARTTARPEALTLSTFRDVPWNGPWYARLGYEPVPDDELDDALRAVRAHEAELGLDVTARLIMRRRL